MGREQSWLLYRTFNPEEVIPRRVRVPDGSQFIITYMYKCKYCGKEFENKQKLGGHLSHCKYNPNYLNIINKWKLSFQYNENNSFNKEQKLYCQYCNKECKSLNSLKQHEIRCKINPNKINTTVGLNHKGENQFTKAKREGRIYIVSEETKKKISWVGKHHSEESKQKISKSRKKYLDNNPDKIPFKLNHSSKQSYPEKYFEELFIKENIPLKYHKQVDRYELDFYNENLMKYVEIDGEQHYSDYMIKHDIERTEYLKQKGWEGIRIRWSEYKKMSDNDKENLINQIKEFLNT